MRPQKKESVVESYERTRRWLEASEDPAKTPVCQRCSDTGWAAKQERCPDCHNAERAAPKGAE